MTGRAETTLYLVRHGESEANAARRYAGQTDSPLTERGREQARAVAAALRDVPIDRVVSSDLSRARDTAALIAREHGVPVETFPELREIDVGEAAGSLIEDASARFDAAGTFRQWPAGESLEDVTARVLAAIERIVAASIAREQGVPVETFRELREIDVGEAAGSLIEDASARFDAAGTFRQWPAGESLEDVTARVLAAIERIVAASPGRTVCVVGHGGVTRILVSHFLGLLPRLYDHPTPTENTNITVVRTDGITYRIESLFGADHLAEPRVKEA